MQDFRVSHGIPMGTGIEKYVFREREGDGIRKTGMGGNGNQQM